MTAIRVRSRVTVGKRGKQRWTVAAIWRDHPGSTDQRPARAVITTDMRSYTRGRAKGKVKSLPLARLVAVKRRRPAKKGKR